MMNISDNAAVFIEQEIELYGDEFAVEKTSFETDFWQSSQTLALLYENICTCARCGLAKSRNKFVFGTGNEKADIVLVGEAPGADEDRIGEPFVGRAGELLDKILASIQLDRKQIYICNILKCRPPQNRDPLPEEIALCKPFLYKQLEMLKPKLILCLGRIAAQVLLDTTDSLSKLRGQVFKFKGAQLLVTYHPAALLRNPEYKRGTWEDVQHLQRLANIG